MNIEKRVKELAEEKIADRPDLFLVSIKMHPNGKLVILVDGDHGMAIADCAAISRYVGFHLEEENTIDQAYNLEVSSPGIDTPLESLRQYNKNIGRTVAVKLNDGSKREGKLINADVSAIVIEEKSKAKGSKSQLMENLISFDQILETKVLISFK